MNADGEVIDRSKLYAKLARVMGDITRVSKAGRNAQQNYNYATEADIADMIRDKLAANNVAFLVDMQDIEAMPLTSSKGTQGFHYRVRFEFTFACGDTGATVTRNWTGEAQDWGDKGISKAATLAEKYFLIKTFVMSTGEAQDDPDSDDGRQEVVERHPASRLRKQEEQPAPDLEWVKDDTRWNALVKKAMEMWGLTLPHTRNRVMSALHVVGGWDARATFKGTPQEAWSMVSAYVSPADDPLIAEAAELGGEVADRELDIDLHDAHAEGFGASASPLRK